VESGVFSALSETRSQAQQFGMGKSVLFHAEFPLY
jgi:hypothetical protein